MIKRFFYLAALIVPSGALHALGLGDIQVSSALNQPLNAQIELVSATAEELGLLKAELASAETFAKHRIDRPAALASLKFTVGRSEGHNVLLVTSRQPIAEPFLTFLVEVSWPRGQLLREYTLLLDPPVYMPETQSGPAPAPVVAPQTAPTETSRSGAVQRPQPEASSADDTQVSQSDPASSESASSTAAPARASSGAQARTGRTVRPAPAASSAGYSAASGDSYTVRSNDTLWRIASEFSGSKSSREVNRTMVALYRANPQAFAGNINQLRAGAILRMPAAEAIQSIGSGEAAAEVHRQYAEWRPGSAAREAASPSSEASRLKLVAPTEKPGSGTAPAAPGATPSTGSVSADAQALRGRVNSLESELAESKRLLDLKNAELARLQQQLGQPSPQPSGQQAQPGQPATPPAPTDTPATPGATPSEAATPATGETPAEPAAQPASPEQAATPPDSTPAQPEASGGIVAWLIAYWYFPVAGLLLLAGTLFFMRRRGEPDFDELGKLAEGVDPRAREPRFGGESDFGQGKPAKKASDAFLVEESGEHPQLDADADPTRTVRPHFAPSLKKPEPVAKTADDTLSSETAINLDQGDALAEADFHMAYGLYDQAADLVRMAIEREPTRRDLKLKLLEIFFVWGNKDAFLQTARQLHESRAQASAGEWDKIVIMGKQIAADDPLFAHAAASGAAPSTDVDLNLEGGDTRLDLDILSESGAKHSGDVMDFDLGESSTEDTGESPALKESTGIDFLLDEPLTGADSGGTTREMAARTQETPTVESQAYRPGYGSDTPTVESPALADRASSTIKEKIDSALLRSGRESHSPDQTAELAIDDLGLDLGAFADSNIDPLEETAHPRDSMEQTDHPSDAATMLASSLSPKDKSPTGTWILDQKTLAATTISPQHGGDDATMLAPGPTGDTARRRTVDVDSTSELEGLQPDDMDLDLDRLEKALASDTIKQPRRGGTADEQFSSDVFGGLGDDAGHDLTATDIDLDTGSVRNRDRDPTKTERIPTGEMGLPELEPVTMSEVGTKLDLARAYMDMGDPEGARNILEEVLSEGSATQKQEAKRLIDSLP